MAQKIKPHLSKGVIEEYIDKTKKQASVKDLADDGCFLISLKHLDRKQSPTFGEWEQSATLANAMDTLTGYCQSPLRSQIDGKKFTSYGGFPVKSKFKHPDHVPLDAEWARIHINGVHILAGHIFKNVFYIVFMDNTHSFFETSLQDK